jgi:GTPase SAR1 family protein
MKSMVKSQIKTHIQKQKLKSIKCLILIYDITKKESFESLNSWLNFIEELHYNDDTIFKILIGNKCDLEDQRKVSIEEGLEFAKKNEMIFYETSAIKGININESFKDIIKILIKKRSIMNEYLEKAESIITNGTSKKNLDKLKNTIKNLEIELKKEKNENLNLNKRMNALENELKKEKNENLKLNTKINELENEMKKQKNENKLLIERIKTLEKYEKEIKALMNKMTDLYGEMGKKNDEINRLKFESTFLVSKEKLINIIIT